jgi:hypothetical protein
VFAALVGARVLAWVSDLPSVFTYEVAGRPLEVMPIKLLVASLMIAFAASSAFEMRLGLLLAVVGPRLTVSTLRRRRSSRLLGLPTPSDGSVDLLLTSLLLVVGLIGLAVHEHPRTLIAGLEVLMVVCSLHLLFVGLSSVRLELARDMPEHASTSSRPNLPAGPCMPPVECVSAR